MAAAYSTPRGLAISRDVDVDASRPARRHRRNIAN